MPERGQQARMPGSFRKFLLFSIVFLLGVGGLLYLADSKRIADFRKEHKAEARHAVNQAAALIGQEIVQLKRSVNLFALAYRPQLDLLIEVPDNDELRDALLQRVKRHFPDAFTFTVTDADGNSLLVDFDHFIGDRCRASLRAFASSAAVDLRIHPSAEAYHFDIMAPFSHQGENGVFFISFYAEGLSNYLKAPPGHELILVHRDDSGLVELTTTGSRDKLQRANFLDDRDAAAISYSRQVSGTGWEVVGLVRNFPEHILQSQVHARSVLIFSVFVLVDLVALLAIYLDDRRLERAMRELEEHKRKLEERIRARTEELSEANRQLHSLSIRDSLTGVANRRHFDNELVREVHRTRRDRQPLSLLMIDVDFFKDYNDSLGHPAGDRCLQEIAAVLSANIHRSSDLLARYGGEEFAVILPGVDQEHAQQLAESLRQAVLSAELQHPASAICPFVTISIGVAGMAADSRLEARELIETADRSLYAAKDKGRNRVEAG